MKWFRGIISVLAIAGGVVVSVGRADDDAAKKREAAAIQRQLQRAEGIWKINAQEIDGTTTPTEQLKDIRLEMKGEQFKVLNGTTELAIGTYKIVAIKGKIIQFDFSSTLGPYKDKTIPAIYEYSTNDKFRFCAAAPGKDRPTDFIAPKGSGQTLTVYQRVKD